MTYKNQDLSSKILNYENRIISLEIENKSLRLVAFELDQKKQLIKDLEKRIACLIEENTKISNMNKHLEISCNKQLNDNFFRSTNNIGQLQGEITNMRQKLNTFNQAINYIETLEKLNNNLFYEIKELKDKFKTSLFFEREHYDDKVSKLMIKFLDLQKYLKQNLQSNQMDMMDNSSKLQFLHNSLLYDEISKSSVLIEELLKKIKEKDYLIASLKTDKEVNIILRKNLVNCKQSVGQVVRKMFAEGNSHRNNSVNKSINIKEEEKNNESKFSKLTTNKMRKTNSSSNFKDVTKCNYDLYSRNSFLDTDFKFSSKYSTSYKENYEKNKFLSEEKSNKNEMFIESLNSILHQQDINGEMISNLNDPLIKEIMNLVYNYACSLRSEIINKCKLSKSVHKKSTSILSNYEYILEEKSPKIIKLK